MRVYLHTFGCKANQYDTEVVRQQLERAGCTILEAPGEAEAAVVNSCTVTHVGEAKMRGFVRRLARARPGIRTVVMGCAAALDTGVIAGLPGVAGVVGGADPELVARALGVAPATPEPLAGFSASSRAWLKVQDGCDEHCTFCAEAVVAEAALLARRHAEIVLTGVHIGTYGRDLPDGWTLGRLAALLIERVAGVRFRLSSVEATEVCGELERLMVERPDRLAPHLHAPLQSGSDCVLKRMGRHWYTATQYRRRIEQIAGRARPLGLGADVIVGFPGETDADHRATLSMIADLPFTYLHVFPYSPRAGTAAPRLGRPPAAEVVRGRGAELRELAARKAAAHREARAGALADLVLEDRRAGVREALSEDYVGVELPADAPWVMGRARLTARLSFEHGRLLGAAA